MFDQLIFTCPNFPANNTDRSFHNSYRCHKKETTASPLTALLLVFFPGLISVLPLGLILKYTNGLMRAKANPLTRNWGRTARCISGLTWIHPLEPVSLYLHCLYQSRSIIAFASCLASFRGVWQWCQPYRPNVDFDDSLSSRLLCQSVQNGERRHSPLPTTTCGERQGPGVSFIPFPLRYFQPKTNSTISNA